MSFNLAAERNDSPALDAWLPTHYVLVRIESASTRYVRGPMSTIDRGAVIEYPAIFGFDSYPRPYVIVSDDSHPFYGEEYIGLVVTTTGLDPATPIDDDAFGKLRPSAVDRVVEEVTTIVGGSSGNGE